MNYSHLTSINISQQQTRTLPEPEHLQHKLRESVSVLLFNVFSQTGSFTLRYI